MRPTRLTARGYRSYADLDYTFQYGATAVTGENGSGKSSLIGAVDVALFGPRGRSLEPVVREGSNEMALTLEFEHRGDTFRVRRSWARGKSALDFERANDAPHPDNSTGWEPLTQGNAADTQALVERTIGLTRSTFLASGYLAQRESDSFTGAQPKDRKRILSDALALDQWQADADKVAVDRRATEKQLAELDARLGMLAERSSQVGPLEVEAAELRVAVDVAQAKIVEHAEQAEAQATRAAELDAADAAWQVANANLTAARAANSAHIEKATAAQVAHERLDGERQDLARLERLDVEFAEVRAKNAAGIEQGEARSAAIAERDTLLARAADLMGQAEQLIGPETDALENIRDIGDRIQALAADNPCCDRCGQTVVGEAHERATASLAAEAEAAAATATDLGTRRAALRTEALKLDDAQQRIVIPSEPEGLRDVTARLAELINVPVDLATVRERIVGLELAIAAIDTDDYREKARRLSVELEQAEQQLASIVRPEPGAADHARAAALTAKAQANAHATQARTTSERLAAVAALLEQAQAAQAEHAAALADRERSHADLDILTRLEQAFGRDGIPAWIVESQALPHIESEANRILSRLGGAISRVELRTEKETKSGATRDALDIVCYTDQGDRELSTFSGGEQSRAEISLALGLVDVLRSRRDADLQYLALDEPSGLDGQGTEALAEVLRERAAGSVVLLASHDPGLRDSFDQSVLVERGPGGSKVTS